MKKRYIAGCEIRVVIGERGFSFSPISGGRSEYITDDEHEQDMLENHPYFGCQYREDVTLHIEERERAEAAEERTRKIRERQAELERVKLEEMKRATAPRENTGEEQKVSETNVPIKEVDVTDDGFTIVEVQSASDARNYLYSKFGIQKTRMLKRDALIDRARECMVVFRGKDF